MIERGAPSPQPVLRRGVHKLRLRADNLHQPQDGLVQRRLKAIAQQRQQLVANPVSQEVTRRVTGIFAEADLALARELFQIRPAHIQQRADELEFGVRRGWRLPLHSRNAFAARAAQQPKEKKFHLVVRVMSQGDSTNSQPRRRSGEEFVTQFSGDHLDGLRPFPGQGADGSRTRGE